MKARQTDVVAALRTTIAALANAEAVEAPGKGGPSGGEHVAGATSGAGSTDVARRLISSAQATSIVEAQIAEREAEAARYEQHGQLAAAAALRRGTEVLKRFVET